jgi:hypothetical protein
VIEFDIGAPRPQVWEYFTQPGQRPKWRAANEVREAVAGGRRGVGTINHCMHGPHAILEEILNWRPFDPSGTKTDSCFSAPVAAPQRRTTARAGGLASGRDALVIRDDDVFLRSGLEHHVHAWMGACRIGPYVQHRRTSA